MPLKVSLGRGRGAGAVTVQADTSSTACEDGWGSPGAGSNLQRLGTEGGWECSGGSGGWPFRRRSRHRPAPWGHDLVFAEISDPGWRGLAPPLHRSTDRALQSAVADQLEQSTRATSWVRTNSFIGSPVRGPVSMRKRAPCPWGPSSSTLLSLDTSAGPADSLP
jgi:hypothetical protein